MMKKIFPARVMLRVSSVVILIVVIAGVSSYFTSDDAIVNLVANSTVEIEVIEEDFQSPVNWAGETVPKKVEIKNTGHQQTLIRVALTPRWVDEAGNPFPGDTKRVMLNVSGNAAQEWVAGDDGFYYYTQKVATGEKTKPLLESVTFDVEGLSLGVIDRYRDKRLIVDVRAEAVHAMREAYEASWAPLANSPIDSPNYPIHEAMIRLIEAQ